MGVASYGGSGGSYVHTGQMTPQNPEYSGFHHLDRGRSNPDVSMTPRNPEKSGMGRVIGVSLEGTLAAH